MESSDTPQSPQSPQSPPTDGVISMMAWLEVHKKRLAIGAGIALVVICGAMLVAQQQAEKERAASAALSDVRLPFSPSAATPPGTAEALAKVASEHKGSQAAARALLLSAGVLFSEAKSPADFAAAEKRFAEVSAEYPTSPWNAQAALGVAASLKAQGKTAERASLLGDGCFSFDDIEDLVLEDHPDQDLALEPPQSLRPHPTSVGNRLCRVGTRAITSRRRAFHHHPDRSR